jgi:hypothetical protein
MSDDTALADSDGFGFHDEPMRATGLHHFIERDYRDTSSPFQWARETAINALEAEASRILFGIEWQGVECANVYRRLIADDGWGMDPDELEAFFNTYGGSGKPIGGVHQNFGIGAKTTLLPWNQHGVVVVSWKNGEGSMIWIRKDPKSSEYGLRRWTVADDDGYPTDALVIEPYEDEELGIDFRTIGPEWIREGGHGTVLLLLGGTGNEDTITGAPGRDEAATRGLVYYLNARFWQLPNDVDIRVEHFMTPEREFWAKTREEAARTTAADDRSGPASWSQTRRVRGAKYYVESQKAAATDTFRAAEGVEIDWWLLQKDEYDDPAEPKQPYIATIYRDEVYDRSVYGAHYRWFGIVDSRIQKRLMLILRPPILDEDDESKAGVYPRSDRTGLLIRGGARAGEPLPIAEWANDFAANLPEPIRAEIAKLDSGLIGSIGDPEWKKKLADRIGTRMRQLRLLATARGRELVDPTHPGTAPRKARLKRKPRVAAPDARQQPKSGLDETGATTVGAATGSDPARKAKLAVDIPDYQWVEALNVEDGLIATYDAPKNTVFLKLDHPVIQNVIAYWQGRYHEQYAVSIRQDVLDVYGMHVAARVAHSESLRGLVPEKRILEDMRTDAALTVSMLGLVPEDHVLLTRLGGKYGRAAA